MAMMRSQLLAPAAEQELRRLELDLPHVAPLTAFVQHIRKREGLEADVPFFDPRDGWTNAREPAAVG